MLVLSFYSFGALLRKRTKNGVVEYPVDPSEIGENLAPKIALNTGILDPNTVLVHQVGSRRLVVGFRPPQWSGLFVDGTDEPLRVPLPGLLMIRLVKDATQPSYRVYAIKTRPRTLQARLYNAPLPNVYADGGICWGNVKRVSAEAVRSPSLQADWAMLLGSRFNDHVVDGKSSKYPEDIRKLFIALEQGGRKVYPITDLVGASRFTLGQAISNMETIG